MPGNTSKRQEEGLWNRKKILATEDWESWYQNAISFNPQIKWNNRVKYHSHVEIKEYSKKEYKFLNMINYTFSKLSVFPKTYFMRLKYRSTIEQFWKLLDQTKMSVSLI